MLERFLSYSKSVRSLSEATVSAYRKDILKFLSYIKNQKINEEKINLSVARSYIAHLSKSGLSVETINRSLSALKRFYDYQVRYHGLKVNPFENIRSLKRNRKLPNFFFQHEMENLLSLPGEGFEGSRDRLLLEVLYSTGCRISELTGINISSIDIRNGIIRVLGKGKKERFVFLGPPALKSLREYLNFRKERLCCDDPDAGRALFLNSRGTRLTNRGAFYIIMKYIERAGMIKKASPHTFRHTFATHVLDRGADIRVVQEMLGHTKLSTTQIYTHIGVEKLKKIYRKAHPHAKRRDI